MGSSPKSEFWLGSIPSEFCGFRSLEQRKVYCSAKQGERMAHTQQPQTVWGGEVVIGKMWGEGRRLCVFLLISLW